MGGKHQHPIKNPGAALAVGAALVIAGSWLIWDAYEGHGRTRPWALRLLPGV